MKLQAHVPGKTVLSFCAVSLLATSMLQATPVCPTSGIFSTLEGFGSTGCSIGGVIFSNFTLTPTVNGHAGSTSNGTAVSPNASNVDFTRLFMVTGTNGEFGFDFNSFTLSALSLGSAQTANLKIGYSIEGTGKERIIDAGLTGEDALAIAPKGTKASTSIAETFTPPGGTACLSSVTHTATCTFTVPGGSANDLIFFNNSHHPPGIPADEILRVTKTLTVTATGKGSDAFISDFRNIVNVDGAAPEPGFYGVLAGGLAGILLFSRRRKKAALS